MTSARAAGVPTGGLPDDRRARTVVGLIVTDITNPHFAALAEEIERSASDHGMTVVTASSGGDFDRELALVADFAERGLDGVLIGSTRPSRSRSSLRHLRIPAVWIDDAHGGPYRVSIGPTLIAGAETLVRHLVDVHGRRRIALLLGQNDRDTEDARVHGWRKGLTAAGLRAELIVEADWTQEGGAEATSALLSLPIPPDAIVASSDMLAVGALKAAAAARVAVPDDLPVVSIDGTDASRFTTPRLTVYRQSVESMARAAVEALLEPSVQQRHVEVEGELVIRESCGCHPVRRSASPPSPSA